MIFLLKVNKNIDNKKNTYFFFLKIPNTSFFSKGKKAHKYNKDNTP